MIQALLKYIVILLIIFKAGIVQSQENYHIEFKFDNYDEDEIIIGYYYADKTLIKDTLIRNEKDCFILSGGDTLASGVYLALTLPDKKFFQFFINENEKFFDVSVDANNLDEPKFKNANDNILFYKYLNYLNKKRPEAEELNKKIEERKESEQDVSQLESKLNKLNEEVKKYQDSVIEKNPGTISALLINANIALEIPPFEATGDSLQLLKYLWYKQHYFDNLDLSNPAALHSPIIHQRINYYMEKLTPMHPDSIINSIDYILQSLKPATASYQYYLSHFLNTYAASKFIGFDAIYVHIAENYYGKGEAPWVDAENLDKIVTNAKRLKPLLIGKIAPDFTVHTEDKRAITLSEVDAEYVILVFWAPECGHCEKALPFILDFNKNFTNRGVQIISICNKTGNKYEECWKSVKEKGMEGLLNVADQYQRSRILANYYVKKTPMIYVLDNNRKILLKNVAAEKLAESMEQIIKSNGSLLAPSSQ